MLFKQSTAQVLYLNVARRKRNLKLQVEVAQIKRVYYLRFSSPTSPTVVLMCASDAPQISDAAKNRKQILTGITTREAVKNTVSMMENLFFALSCIHTGT